MLKDLENICLGEARYFVRLLFAALAVAIAAGIYHSATGSYRAFLETGTLIQLVVAISSAINMGYEKRWRMLLLLPVPKKVVGLSRPVPILFTGVVLLLLWIVFAFFAQDTPEVAISGTTIIMLVNRFLLNTAVFLVFSILFELADRMPLVGFPLVTLFGFSAGFTLTRFPELRLMVGNEAYEQSGVLVQLAIAAGALMTAVVLLILLDMLIFLRKKSYLK